MTDRMFPKVAFPTNSFKFSSATTEGISMKGPGADLLTGDPGIGREADPTVVDSGEVTVMATV